MSQVLRERKGKTDKNEQLDSKLKPPDKHTDHENTLPAWAKILIGVATCIGLYWWFIENKHTPITFASVSQRSDQLFYNVNCSKDYEKEPFEECKPRKCARVVMDNLVTEEEASFLLGVAKKGMSYGGSKGGASILDLHSGALSMGDKFVNIYRILPEKDSFTEKDFEVYRSVKDRIRKAIATFFNIPVSKLYLTKPTFFSKMNTTEAKTIHDEYWHPHIDKVTYGSFHYTSLLYLSTYKKDFTGGRFVFVDSDTNRTVEPRLGRVSFFTSGSENLHFVEKLKDGVRHAITISFTCDPSMAITDPSVT